MRLKIYDGFETKEQAKSTANNLRAQKVQYVRVMPINTGRLKWGVFLGGRKSSMYV